MTTNCDGLRKALRKKEKENEEKEREIASLNQVIFSVRLGFRNHFSISRTVIL